MINRGIKNGLTSGYPVGRYLGFSVLSSFTGNKKNHDVREALTW
jgi:hypothetical protein